MVINKFKKLRSKIKKIIQNKYKRSYSQSGEDMILNTIFAGIKNGIYVDVGANDPYIHSNTQYFYEKGWNGINIDPNNLIIKRLNKIRKRDKNIKALISDTGKKLEYYYYESSSYNGCVYYENIPSKLLYKEIIESIPLNSLLMQNNCTKFDLLSIDVEGHDLNVLRSLDLTKIRPNIIIIESFSMDVLEDINSEIFKYAVKNDYRYLCRSVTNTFYISKEFLYRRFKK